ncbi:MAG TPA: hypothetical protein VNC50_12535, partial [Planctomycetia bacterium]|nr:hypothetical protein [Planctomycetia bacterium]
MGDWEPPALPPEPVGDFDIYSVKEPNSDPALVAAVVRMKPVLAELEKACAFPPSPLPFDYAAIRPEVVRTYESDVRRLMLNCNAAVYRAIAADEPREAFRCILLGLQLSRRLEAEPFVLDKFNQGAVFSAVVATLARTLGHVDPSAHEFAKLDAALAEDEKFPLREVILGDQALTLRLIDRLDSDDYAALDLAPGAGRVRWDQRLMGRFRASWLGEPERLEEQIWLLRHLQLRIDAVDDLGPGGLAALQEYERRVARLGKSRLAANSPRILAGVREAKFRHQLTASLARGALRAGRYVAAHGKLPNSIAEFSDAEWPPKSDLWFGPSGPHYEKTEEGFL